MITTWKAGPLSLLRGIPLQIFDALIVVKHDASQERHSVCNGGDFLFQPCNAVFGLDSALRPAVQRYELPPRCARSFSPPVRPTCLISRRCPFGLRHRGATLCEAASHVRDIVHSIILCLLGRFADTRVAMV